MRNEDSDMLRDLVQELFQQLMELELNRLQAQFKDWVLCWDEHFGAYVKTRIKEPTVPYPLERFLSALEDIPDGSEDRGLLSALMRTQTFPNQCSVFSHESELALNWKKTTRMEVALKLASKILSRELVRIRAPSHCWRVSYDDHGLWVHRESDVRPLAYDFFEVTETMAQIPDNWGQEPIISDGNVSRTREMEERRRSEDTLATLLC